MMSTTTIFPTTQLELTALGSGELVRFPISFSEYWDLLEKVDYRVDYHEDEAIAMSYENEAHSEMVTEFSHLLKNIFPRTNLNYKVHNSNRPIYIQDCEQAVFSPDGSVINQPPVYFEYRPGMTAETRPFLLFEVLSKTTRKYDLGEKLPCYKKFLVYSTSFTLIWSGHRSPFMNVRAPKVGWMWNILNCKIAFLSRDML